MNKDNCEYLERARALLPQIDAAAVQIDRDRRIPQSIVDALHGAGLFRLLLPRSLNGAEIDPVTFVEVMETIGGVDASTAWCLCQTAGVSMTAAYLGQAVAHEIFGRDPRAVMAWGPGPGSKAIVADGGYRVTGTWSFASGGRLANWLGAQCPVYDPDGTPRRRRDGRPEIRTMIFPASSAPMTDTWDVIGLRGTASDSYTVTDLFVPQERSVVRDNPAERREPGLLYCFPTGSFFSSGFAGVALGLARTMLDAFVALAHDKTPRGAAHTLRQSGVAQSQVAQCEARLRSARVYLLTTLGEIWEAVGGAGDVTLEQRMAIRLASTHAMQQAGEVVDTVYHAAGATAIFRTGAFERRFRDMHAITQQLQGRIAHFETVGRFLLGLDADTSWL